MTIPITVGPSGVYRVIPDGYALPVSSRIGTNLRGLRRERQLTQEQLADKAGLKQSEVSKYERGTKPEVKNLVKLASALEVSLDRLVIGVDERYDLLRQSSGTSFASNERTPEGFTDAARAATTRVLRETTLAYETLAAEVRAIAAQFDTIVARLRRDPLSLENKPAEKRSPHRRSRR